MQIATAYSHLLSTQHACEEALSQLLQNAKGKPSLILCYYTEHHTALQIAKKLQFACSDTPLLGCSSCQGLMTERGYHNNNSAGLGLWAIWDSFGSYGTSIEYYDAKTIQPEQAAKIALDKALVQAGREGELPELIWLHATPGYEERVIAGLQEVLGDRVPIAGGSSADNLATGRWSILAGEQVETQGIALAVLFPGGEIGYSFHSGYVADRALGTVTASNSRTILTIDQQPAAEVYNRALGDRYQLGNQQVILESSSLAPLGREVGEFDTVPLFKLSHPRAITQEGGLILFSDVQVGDRLFLMEGTPDSLVSRAARVTKACFEYQLQKRTPVGALVIYCAGCMLTVREQMETVVDNVRSSLGQTPAFIGPFTFGEQGHFLSGGNGHGNLMISSVVFYQDS